MSLEIAGPGLSAAVDPDGAQLTSVRSGDGRELMWEGDPGSWPDRSLTLFPLIGPTVEGRIAHAGRTYPMPDHGFAHERRFAVAERSASRCTLELRDDERTRSQYPFPFVLRVGFEIAGGTLEHTIAVENTGTEPLPADVGFHPGFKWPLEERRSKSEYAVLFADDEPAPIRRGTGDPVALLPGARPTPVERRTLPLRDDLFRELAIVWDRLRSRAVTYGAPGGRGLRVEFPDSPYLALWMIPGARFICIEPWQGLPRPVDFDGPLETKPGIAHIEPGQIRVWRLHMTPLEEVET